MTDREPDAADASPAAGGSLAAHALHATWAVAAAQVASQLVSLVVLAALYRLVAAADFGLLAMALTWTVLVRLFGSLSLGVAIVQRPNVSQAELSALFWFNLAIAGVATTLGAALAPLVARLYGVGALAPVAAVLCGTIWLSAFGAVHQALLERRLQLARVAWIRLAAQLAGGAAAVAAAWRGAGVWALVVQQYAEWGALGLSFCAAARWRPGPPRRTAGLRPFLNLGGQYTAGSLLAYLAGNFDKILLGRLGAAGETALGFYSQAFNLMLRPTYAVTTPLAAVMLPVLARAACDPPQYRRLLLEFFRLIAWLLFPVSIGLLLVGRDVMRVIGGPAWEPAGAMLVALAPAILLQGYFNVLASVFASAGRTDRLLRVSLLIALLLCQAFVCGRWLGRQFGPPEWGPALGVAWSYSLTLLGVLGVPCLAYLLHTVGIRGREFLAVVRAPLVAALGIGCVVALMQQPLESSAWQPASRLLLEILAGAAAYALLARRSFGRWRRGEPW